MHPGERGTNILAGMVLLRLQVCARLQRRDHSEKNRTTQSRPLKRLLLQDPAPPMEVAGETLGQGPACRPGIPVGRRIMAVKRRLSPTWDESGNLAF